MCHAHQMVPRMVVLRRGRSCPLYCWLGSPIEPTILPGHGPLLPSPRVSFEIQSSTCSVT
jgi:hypothetical protein